MNRKASTAFVSSEKNSVVKISLMFTQYSEYYIIILREGAFFRGHTAYAQRICNIFQRVVAHSTWDARVRGSKTV